MSLGNKDTGGVCGEGRGVYPCLFYNGAGNAVNTGDVDPHERHMDRPEASPDNFIRWHDLGG